MQVILSLGDGLEFEEAPKAKSCQVVNPLHQAAARQTAPFVIDDRGLYDLSQ